MEQIFIIREAIVNFYKRFETYLLFVFKFLFGMFVFSSLGDIGLYMPMFSAVNQLPYVLLMAMLFTVIPLTMGYGLIIINICIQLSSAIGVMAFVGVFLLLILFFYARLAPRESVLIIATFFAFRFGVPHIVPLMAGLYFGITSVIPVSLGIMIVSFVPLLRFLLDDAFMMSELLAANFAVMPEHLGELYVTIFSEITTNQAWVFTAFTFAMVIFIVYIISRFTIDHAREIAVGVGIVVAVISAILAQIIAVPGASLFATIVSIVVSGVLAFLALFFDMVLDYQRTERVQFEDEANFYQVKIIPKISLTREHRVVKRISPWADEDEEQHEKYAYDEEYEYLPPKQAAKPPNEAAQPVRRGIESAKDRLSRRVSTNREYTESDESTRMLKSVRDEELSARGARGAEYDDTKAAEFETNPDIANFRKYNRKGEASARAENDED